MNVSNCSPRSTTFGMWKKMYPEAKVTKFGTGSSVTRHSNATPIRTPSSTVMLEPSGSTPPDGFELEQNYPNPFHPETRIRFTLPVDGDMRLQIYNSAGQMVHSLADGTHRAGIYDVTGWQRHNAGHNIASGTYLYNLEMPAAGLAVTRRMTLTR